MSLAHLIRIILSSIFISFYVIPASLCNKAMPPVQTVAADLSLTKDWNTIHLSIQKHFKGGTIYDDYR